MTARLPEPTVQVTRVRRGDATWIEVRSRDDDTFEVGRGYSDSFEIRYRCGHGQDGTVVAYGETLDRALHSALGFLAALTAAVDVLSLVVGSSGA